MGLRSRDWLGHSRPWNASYEATPSLNRGGVFGDHCHVLKDPATFHLQCPCWWKEVFTQNLTIHGPIHSFLYTDQSSWSFAGKTAPKHDVSTPMLHSRYGVSLDATQHSFSSKPDKLSFYQKVLFGFIWPYDILPILFWIIQMLSSKLQMAWTCTGLSRGDTSGHCRIWVPGGAVCYLMVAFVTLVPALCRSFTRSPVWFLDFLLTVLVIILTPRGEILRGAPDRGRLSIGLVCLPFSNIAPTVDFSHQAAYLLQIQSSRPWCRSTILFLCPLTALWSWP